MEDVYVYTYRQGCYLFLLEIYVDNLIIASKSIRMIAELKYHLQKSFSRKSIRDMDYVLTFKIGCNKVHKKLNLSQETYVKKILVHFEMTNCQPIACPFLPSTSLEVHKGPAVHFMYFQAVKSMMYLAMGTRSKLAFIVGLVSHFVSNSNEIHVKVVKRTLRCVQAISNINLTFDESSDQRLVDYIVVDYASCTSRRHSTSRYVFFYG